MENLSGRQFNQYWMVAPLGEGGMAAVYRAEQTGNLKRTVAIKVLPQHLADNPEFLKRFNQEAQILASLQYPHILPIFDYGEAEGFTYLVMPYIESGTLASLIQGKPMPLAHVREVMIQVAEALDYAHSLGLVHRDVKPSNILIDQRGNCLLSDFGIAKIIQDTGAFSLTTAGFIGTPMYVSPEQGQGQTVDGRSDIYSLGVVMYEMVTGETPFKGETPVAVIFKHIYDLPPLPSETIPNIPPEVEQIILKALEKEPEHRFQTAIELAQAIRQAIPEGKSSIHESPSQQINNADDFHVSVRTTPVSLPAVPQPTERSKNLDAPANKPKSGWLLPVGSLVVIFLIILSSFLFRGFLPSGNASPESNASNTTDVSTVKDTTFSSCLDTTIADIPQEKQISLEVGSNERDLEIPASEIEGDDPIGPLGIRLTMGGEFVGGIQFLVLHEDNEVTAFPISTVWNEDCAELTDFFNATRPSAGQTLGNWDSLEFPLTDGRYYVRFGWQGDHVRLVFRPVP